MIRESSEMRSDFGQCPYIVIEQALSGGEDEDID